LDYRKETADLITAFHQYKNDFNSSAFIKGACAYFDSIKERELSQSEIQFLFFIANEVGIPQYFDLLNSKFQEGNLQIEATNLLDLGGLINDSSLYINGDVKLHRYQKKVLDAFTIDLQNRYVLSAPTSFGKTFLVYQIMEKMKYKNIVLIFPTISLLAENYSKLLQDATLLKRYSIHTLSDDASTAENNIWIYTPERFLSFLDTHSKINFDFIFIDEIYKIDNEYIIDGETTGENERDIAYRIALEYACRTAKDILLAGPYMEINSENEIFRNHSLNNFISDKSFKTINYNDIEIVDKEIMTIKGRKTYSIDGLDIEMGEGGVYHKASSIINALTTSKDNTILYYSTKAGTERYAKEIIPFIKSELCSDARNEFFAAFIRHIEVNFGQDWIVVNALKHGIGIHHGLVPKYIQKQIIEFFNSGLLSVLISTTTITEGVNTTAKNIIVCSDKKGNKALRHFDAMNIAGRAGRFNHHFKGRVIVLGNNFEDTYKGKEDVLKHKNFDLESNKTEVDYLITDDKYLKKPVIEDKIAMYLEVEQRNISKQVIEQFKSVEIRDKLKIYDVVCALSMSQREKIKKLIQNLAAFTQITWDGFQTILDIIQPIIKDVKLSRLIETHCKDDNGEPNDYSILTAKVHFYLKGGFFGLLEYTLKAEKRDKAIRDTSDMVYNVLKYQLVKYIGIFDLMYKCAESQRLSKPIDEISGITKLVKKLEYSVLSENARILSDFGVPYKIIEFYENNDSHTQKNFDEYEQYIDQQISNLIK